MGSSVIVPPAQGTFGDMNRYELYSVGTWEWDASIVKAWQIKERLTTQFRAEFYNVRCKSPEFRGDRDRIAPGP
jgi:hypothetical protein